MWISASGNSASTASRAMNDESNVPDSADVKLRNTAGVPDSAALPNADRYAVIGT